MLAFYTYTFLTWRSRTKHTKYPTNIIWNWMHEIFTKSGTAWRHNDGEKWYWQYRIISKDTGKKRRENKTLAAHTQSIRIGLHYPKYFELCRKFIFFSSILRYQTIRRNENVWKKKIRIEYVYSRKREKQQNEPRTVKHRWIIKTNRRMNLKRAENQSSKWSVSGRYQLNFELPTVCLREIRWGDYENECWMFCKWFHTHTHIYEHTFSSYYFLFWKNNIMA